jgi:hypothetical protein
MEESSFTNASKPDESNIPNNHETTSVLQDETQSSTKKLHDYKDIFNETKEDQPDLDEDDIISELEKGSSNQFETVPEPIQNITPRIINDREIQEFMALPCDPETLENQIDESLLEKYINIFLDTESPLAEFTFETIQEMIISVIVAFQTEISVFRQEPVDFAYYIGDLNGDFKQTQRLIQYFQALLTNFPTTKIVFLGNYIGQNPKDFPTLILLYLFYMQNHENVILLRGINETVEFAHEIGFWDRIYDYYSNQQISQMQIYDLNRQIAFTFQQLPLFHIALMNDGQISVYSAHSGIPFLTETPEEAFYFRGHEDMFKNGTEFWESLDKYSQQILTGIPDETLNEKGSLFEISNPKEPRFSKELLKNFFDANQIHYMVRAQKDLGGFRYNFDAFVCSIFSTEQYGIPKPKHFTAKILRLAPGTPPSLIGCLAEELKADLEKSFRLDTHLLNW